jgi:hypothetical protein
MYEWTTTKSRKAKLTRYFNGKEFIEKEVSCFFHGFFQYQDEKESCAIAIIELEDGSVQTVDPDNIVFEKEN